MAKGLIIVESPSKAKTISKFLNNKYIIKSSVGHIRDLPKSTLGIDVEDNFKAKYVTDRSKSKIIKELKEAVGKVDTVYLASDHDREGEAIAWHLTEVLKKELKNKTIYRIVFNEITKKAIVKAIDAPGQIDMQKVDAQQARRILDRVVGYKVSPLLWKVITKNLSAGRVQSVALKLVCDREIEIEKFIPQEYWKIDVNVQHNDFPEFKAKLNKFEGKTIEITNEEEALKLEKHVDGKDFTLARIEENEKNVNPGPAYITSTLQQDAARLSHFSAKKTMMIAQQLYEGLEVNGETIGLITYMRTDSTRISDEALENCRNKIVELFGDSYLHKTIRTFKNKNSAQDAHEAIRPTHPELTPDEVASFLTADQLKLYKLIWKKFFASQMASQKLMQKNIFIQAGNAEFKAQGQTILFDGFTKVYPYSYSNKENNIDSRYKEGMNVEVNNFRKEQNFTKPPARYSEASLIKDLESKGIGRPSTYATITNTIIVRKYVENIERRFIPTRLGRAVNEFLAMNFDKLFNISFTANMESELDDIEFGKANWKLLLKEYYDSIAGLIGTIDVKASKEKLIEKTDLKCEKCGSDMVIKWSKKGQILACSNYPECSNIKNFERLEDGSLKIIEPEKVDHECPKCGSVLIVREGRFGKFIACSQYPTCKHTEPYTTGIKCPECEDGKIVEMKNKKGKFFYGCTNYPECKFISNNKPVDIECSECGSKYLEEMNSKSKGKYKRCPNCKTEYK